VGVGAVGGSASRIPVLKMPPSWFNDVSEAILASGGSRAAATRSVLSLHPEADEKLAMRAFAVPTLTRLHYVRAGPGTLAAAPNGSQWLASTVRQRDRLTGLNLRDLMVHRLGVAVERLEPTRILSEARSQGKLALDRVRVFAAMLTQFPPPPEVANRPCVSLGRGGNGTKAESLAEFLRVVVPPLRRTIEGGGIVRLDPLRSRTMKILAEGDRTVSSFLIDRALLAVMDRGELCTPIGSSTNTFGGLVLGRRPFDAVRAMAEA
jgi:hypothetical protein